LFVSLKWREFSTHVHFTVAPAPPPPVSIPPKKPPKKQPDNPDWLRFKPSGPVGPRIQALRDIILQQALIDHTKGKLPLKPNIKETLDLNINNNSNNNDSNNNNPKIP
jgi:hypothetical protein